MANETKGNPTQGRIGKWTQKMLDFSARNRLLNIPRDSKRVFRLLCTDVATLQDKLADDQTITIQSFSESVGEKTYEDWQAGKLPQEQVTKLLDIELAHHRLCVALPPKDVRRRLSDLYHDAKTDLEESGVNTLFLAIGTVQWVEPGTGADRRKYRAPVLMVPVRLGRASMAEGVKMYRLDEDTTINPTLVEFLRSQFGLVFDGLDPLPTDDSGVDVARILQIIRDKIAGREGWEVGEDVVLGCFSFGKFVMWKDMTDRVEELKKHPLVEHLISGGGEFDDGIEVFEPEEIAQHLRPGEIFCPVSADSSQLTAVLYSELGKTFVLHGPPGTGKSQTITNLIAHNLAKGRRVLFVSEKKAALDVVKNRLDKIGLTPFCLELHSNKTEKRRFYEQIKEALEVAAAGEPGEWQQTVADFAKYRGELNEYIAALHHVYPNGLTPYACFSRAIRYGSKANAALIGVDCLTHERDAYRDSRQAVIDLVNDFRSVPEEALKAMPELRTDSWNPTLEHQLRSASEELASAAEAFLPGMSAVLYGFGKDNQYSVASVVSTVELIAKLRERLAGYDRHRMLKLDYGVIENRLKENRESFVLVRFFKNRALMKELEGLLSDGKLTVEKLAEDLESLRTYQSFAKRYYERTGCTAEEKDLPETLKNTIDGFLGVWTAFLKKYDGLLEFAKDEGLRDDISALPEKCAAIVDNLEGLRGVIRYRKTLAAAKALGMGAFADYILANDDGAMDIAEVFDDSYAAKMLEEILARTPVLSGFTGLGQEERIAKFRELDRKYTALSRKMVFAKLAANLPRRRNGPCPDGTELGMIKRECEKKTRQKAVRQILEESRTLIPALKPCFLMSPLSVAQYLPVDTEPFDLVVFDEASQIPVWDAIGVIARGKQLVVVGDPKQMPPTNFFQKGDAEEEDEDSDAIEDQESILDECLVAGVHSTYLNWHYRSRHESLIAFSNEHYYSNKLCTFPAASDSPRLGVKFMFVEGGVCAKSGKGPKTNPVEAKALVDYICEKVRQPGYEPRSIGVVTFSLPQQKLIRTMLEERREQDPEIERLLPEEGPNAYFVKNLENVQGDESDVILFSVGFAPDENGKFAMNFGPLNRSGGERRLNVAITRAKEQVVVFSSIHASQIDAGEDGRTKAVGAGHLKAFLDYAEHGLSPQVAASANSAGDGFGDAVAAFLESCGYRVARNVGCSQYRIDIAVCDPVTPGKYLLGVECDGPSYAEQRTAQDRDINRAGVLRGLGWHMCRVWSLDWAYDRKRAEEHLLALIDAARKGKDDSVPEPEPVVKEEPTAVAPTGHVATVAQHPVYSPWKSKKAYPHDRFYDDRSLIQIIWMMKEIVAQESPICETTLRKRVTKAWGLTRITDKVNRVLDKCLPTDGCVTTHATGNVFWAPDQDPKSYRDFRVPSSDAATLRTLEELPPEELANAMRETLSEFGTCPQSDLYREMVRVFSLPSLTARARSYLDVAYALL